MVFALFFIETRIPFFWTFSFFQDSYFWKLLLSSRLPLCLPRTKMGKIFNVAAVVAIAVVAIAVSDVNTIAVVIAVAPVGTLMLL